MVCVTAVGQIKVNELELLRAVADSLDIPLPPFVKTGRTITHRAGIAKQGNTSKEPKGRVMMGGEPIAGKLTSKVV